MHLSTAFNLVVFCALLFLIYHFSTKSQSLSRRVFTGLVLGLIYGFALQLLYGTGTEVMNETLNWTNLVGDIYVRLLRMIIMPLILVTMIASVLKMDAIASVGKIGVSIVGMLVLTTAIAALIGIGITLITGLSAEGMVAGARELAEVPAQIRPILQSALAGEYSDLKGLLRELATSEAAPGMDRALRQLAGSATHPGRKHTLNQDFIAVLNYSLDQSGQVAPMGLYIVADGMGGHAAGELASQDSVRQAFLRFIEQRILPDLQGKTRKLSNDVSGDTMHALVAQANQLVYQSRQSSGSDRGTTMTAALVIGSRATVANVGDSRTYLWRGGQLQPVTRDHSLVASLVQAGQITPEEVYTHPQRNQIYRSLGDRPEVEVDLFHVSLQKGDRLLLCSDGVWEMVRDAGLQRVLAAALNPQTACDRLVELANANGGEDNISCIVVNME